MVLYGDIRFLNKREAKALLEGNQITGPYQERTIKKERFFRVMRSLNACRREAEKLARKGGYDVVVSDEVTHNFDQVISWACQTYEFYKSKA